MCLLRQKGGALGGRAQALPARAGTPCHRADHSSDAESEGTTVLAGVDLGGVGHPGPGKFGLSGGGLGGLVAEGTGSQGKNPQQRGGFGRSGSGRQRGGRFRGEPLERAPPKALQATWPACPPGASEHGWPSCAGSSPPGCQWLGCAQEGCEGGWITFSKTQGGAWEHARVPGESNPGQS